MADVNVTRRHVTKDYYQASSGGYFGGSGGSSITQRHWEVGRLDLVTGDSKNIVMYFSKPFASDPVGLSNLKVYRFTEFATGQYGVTDVLFYFTLFGTPHGATKYGFQIIIDASEEIDGVTVEWMFT